MKKRMGKISVTVVVILVLALAISLVTQVPAVPRSFDNGVRFIFIEDAVFTAQTDQLFTVTGGPIEIVGFFGHCTTDVASDPGNMIIQLDGTSGDDLTFSAAASANALNDGDIVRFSNAMDNAVTDVTANVGAGQPLSWFCFPGEIEQYCASTGTGNITWYMSYRRLDRASRVSVSSN